MISVKSEDPFICLVQAAPQQPTETNDPRILANPLRRIGAVPTHIGKFGFQP